MRTIYLDFCSSTPVAASVREAMLPYLNELYGHPSHSHWFGRAAQEAIEDARNSLANLLNCHPTEVAFTAGGTESTNLGLLGVARALKQTQDHPTPHMILSSLEHGSVRSCARRLGEDGWEVSVLNCDSNGKLSVDQFEQQVQPNTCLASIIHANHHIGTIQPVERISRVCRDRRILLHSDACQSVGKIPTRVDSLGVDLLSLSGHKFYAPKGIGALYIRSGVEVAPILFGQDCDASIRPGTSNVPFIVALGQAASLAGADLSNAARKLDALRDLFHQDLEKTLGQAVRIHGGSEKRIPGVLSLELPRVHAYHLMRKVPELCAGDTHCTTEARRSEVPPNSSSGIKVCNATHRAIGLTEDQSARTIRISFGWTTSQEELAKAVQLIAAAYESLSG